METRKIAIACFIGGVLCTLVALLATPKYWLLGTIAGFAAGYLAYDFRGVLRAIPIAFKRARKGGWSFFVFWRDGIGRVWRDMVKWFRQPHPFYYSAMVLYALIIPALVPVDMLHAPKEEYWDPVWIVCIAFGTIVFSIFVVNIIAVILYFFAFIGSRYVTRSFWMPFFDSSDNQTPTERKTILFDKGYEERELTYKNALGWTALGILLLIEETVNFFTWRLELSIGRALWAVVKFVGRFFKNMFLLIHSEKRLLCAIDGMLGGLTSYLMLVSDSGGVLQRAFIVFLGGVLGAVIGIPHWEILSKRVLRVHLRRAD